MMKVLKNNISYIKRHFWYQFLLAVVLITLVGIANIRFSKAVVGEEIIKLHQSILHQSVSNTAAAIGGMKDSLLIITENSRLIEWLKADEKEESKEELSYVDNLVQDEVYLNYKKRNRFRVYIYDLKSLRYHSDSTKISRDTLQQYMEQAVEEKADSRDDIYILGPVKSDEAGIYRHSFFMVRPVKDLLTDNTEGYVLFEISEKSIYDTYANLNGKGHDYCLMDCKEHLISGKNKNKIGTDLELNRMKDGADLQSGYTPFTNNNREDVYFYEKVLGTDWYLIEQVNVHEIWKSLDRTGYFSLCMIIVFILLIYPLTILSGRNILKPVDRIKDKMCEVAEGNLTVRINEEEKGKGEFFEIANSFNYMAQKLEQQMDEIRNIERKKHLLELDFLQAQINPHFIYNTLSSIRFYVEMGKNEEAEDMLIDFTKILRKTLSRSEKFISLKEEIETLIHYIRLQKARYRDRFEVEFDIEEKTNSSIIPDFILQPIVENAIFYSLREDRVCHILIKSYSKGQDFYVSVKDDGIGMDEKKIDTVLKKDLNMNKVGIKNVNERLKLNFGDIYGLKIISEKGKGTEVILKMPFIAERNRRHEDINSR